MDSLAKLRVLMPGGTVTAGNASQQNDASAACLIVAEDKLAELGLTPMATLVGWAAAGCEPSHMGIGPVPAVKKLLARLNLTLDDMDLVELNEAFACQVLAVLKGWEWHDQAPSSTSSTSTAPASRWATPLAPPACAFWPRCCTSLNGARAAMAWRPCASVAARALPPFSSVTEHRLLGCACHRQSWPVAFLRGCAGMAQGYYPIKTRKARVCKMQIPVGNRLAHHGVLSVNQARYA
jgi:hypothetical protein